MKVGRPLITVEVGQVFGSLAVQRVYSVPRKDGGVRLRCIVLCKCGSEHDTALVYLRHAKHPQCRSCAGKDSQTKRGNTGVVYTAEYAVWGHMRSRCNNPKHPAYVNYGGRGIRVCKRWETFKNFFADMGARPTSDHTLERLNNDGDYKPSNCVWALPKEQSRNKRSNRWLTHNGETLILADWAKRIGTQPTTLWLRLEKGWSVADTLTVPIRKRTTKPKTKKERSQT